MPELKQEISTKPMTTEERNKIIEEFMEKKRKKEQAEERKQQRQDKLIRESPHVFHHPEGGYKCVSAAHEEGEEPDANFLFKHGGVFGDDFPPIIPLCEYCANITKMIPLNVSKAQFNITLKKLADLANKLDALGLYEEASAIDRILK